jgi:hypothetical protein
MDTPITFLATSRKSAPARRVVSRRFDIRSTARVSVEARHPQFGMLARGAIRGVPGQLGDGAFGRWQVTDYDHKDLGEVVGDYLDAERVLLDATAGLDEPVPANQLDPQSAA